MGGKSGFGCWRGTGQGFRKVVEKLGRNRRSAGWPNGYGEPSAGLGAVMRIPPVGTLGWEFPSIVQVVSAVTQITHTDPLATVSACAIALACHMLCQETPSRFDTRSFLSKLVEHTQRVERDVDAGAANQADNSSQRKRLSLNSDLIALTGEVVDAQPKVALQGISEHTKLVTGKEMVPTTGFAPSGVAACLYFFLHDAQAPDRALFNAINAGGDTDTIGAIVGPSPEHFMAPQPTERSCPTLSPLT